MEEIDKLMTYLENCHYAEIQVYNNQDENYHFFSEESVIHMFFKINNHYKEIIDILKREKTNPKIVIRKFDSVLENYIHMLSKFKFDENYNQARMNYFLTKYKVSCSEFEEWFDVIESENPLYIMLSKNICFFDPEKFDQNFEIDSFLTDMTYSEVQEVQNIFESYIKNIYTKKLIDCFKKEKYFVDDTDGFSSEIFKNSIALMVFKEYTEKYIENYQTDFSFIFQAMLKKNLIYDIKHKKFMDFLQNKEYINDDQYDQLIIDGSFISYTKSAAKFRKDRFKLVFDKFLK